MSDCSTSHSCSTVTLRPGSLNQIEHTDMTYSLLHLPTEKKTFTSSKNFIVAEPISTTLLCPNCFQIYVDPVVMGCGHILCQGCTLLSSKLKNKDSCLELSTELKTLSNTTTLHPFSTSSTTTITTTSVMTSESLTETLERCPLCEPKRNEFNEIIPPTTLLQQIHNSLSTLLIECSLCNEYMLLTDFEKHHSEDCKSVLLQCSPQASCTLDDEEHDPSTHSLRQTSMKPISSNNVSHVNESFENYVGNETGSSTSSLDASPVLESHPSYTLVSSLQQEEPFRFSLPFSLNEVATVEGQSFVQGVYFEYLPGIFEDLPHVHLFQQCVCRGVLPTIMVHETTELRNLEMDPPLRITLEDGNFALRFLGYYKAPVSGYYTFFLTSNDGSMLWLDHRLLISNSKKHYSKEMSQSIFLKQGMHPLEIHYFHCNGKLFEGSIYTGAHLDLKVEIYGENHNFIQPKHPILPDQLWCNPISVDKTVSMPQAQLMNLLQEKEQLQLKALKLETKLIHQTQRLREYETLSAFQWKGPQHDLPLVSELQLLRKLYFNVLVLSLKLQYSKNIAMDEVWDEFKTENVLSWPRLLTKKFEDLQV